VELAVRSLGWAGDERDLAFFGWKHDDNPFGPSPIWGALDGDRLAGFRTFLRWRFEEGRTPIEPTPIEPTPIEPTPIEPTPIEMVRAVDTATHPDHQGRGVFTRLTLHAVEEMTADGIGAVYNTPNDQSRPGYLKMGWHVLGRPRILVMPETPATVVRMLRAREAAAKWSEPVAVGEPAAGVGDAPERPSTGSIRRRAVEGYTRWRYGFEPLHYRSVEVRGGLMVFRVRRRGPLREVAIVEWRSDRRDPRAVHRLVREVGDYAVGVGLPGVSGLLPLPRQGPIVTWRPLARAGVPALTDLALDLGDLELF
jgi:GNAT superfamily N-acetyltransferase